MGEKRARRGAKARMGVKGKEEERAEKKIR